MTNLSKEELQELILNKPSEFNNLRKINDTRLDLSESDFSGVPFSDIDFSNTDLTGSAFCDCNLSSINFSNSDLTSADFARAAIVESDFSDAIMNGTNLAYTTLHYSNFAGADMTGCVLDESDLTNSDLSASMNLNTARFDETTIFPELDMLPEEFDTSLTKDVSDEDGDEPVLAEDY